MLRSAFCMSAKKLCEASVKLCFSPLDLLGGEKSDLKKSSSREGEVGEARSSRWDVTRRDLDCLSLRICSLSNSLRRAKRDCAHF